MIKVVHVIYSISKNAGGTSSILKSIVEASVYKSDQSIIAFQSNNDLPISKHIKVTLVKRKVTSKYFSLNFIETLRNINPNIYHGHGLWLLPVYWMFLQCKKKQIPFIISTHGMLEPYAFKFKKTKKRIAFLLFQKSILSNSACIHATSQEEAKNIRKLGFSNPIAIIPNGINLNEFKFKKPKKNKTLKSVLYLSRIHPIKGIENLINAWKQLDSNLKINWQLKIIGNGEESYINSLNKLIQQYDLENSVKLVGPLYGNDKIEEIQKADLFVLPSFSENFGIVVAEALACGVPVITTKGTPWEDLKFFKAGWWIDIGVEPLLEGLIEAMSLSDEERFQMGINGRNLALEKYNIESVARQMIELYNWILSENDRPDFILY